MRFVTKEKKKVAKKKVRKGHDKSNLRELEESLDMFLEEEAAEKMYKAGPTSSQVHVPTTDHDDDLANEHERSVQPTAPPTKLVATRRSRGVIPPVVANLEAEVEKALNEVELSSFYKDGGTNDLYPAPAQLGDNDAVGLYDMQNIVAGIDWEMANSTNGDEEQAQIYALDNLADDPNYYRRKRLEDGNTSDQLALTKDTSENEEASVSDWPLSLDLGSGHAREPGHVGIDVYPYDSGTYTHDLALGIPAKDSSVSKVRLVNALSEFDEEDQKGLLSEIQRVLMPGGEFHYEGPNDIWNYPDWIDSGKMELTKHEDSEESVEKSEAEPYFKQQMRRLAVPDAATADDAEPRIGVAQYDQLPADALLAMDALGYYWSDSTSSGRGNRVHGYPSQGSLLTREEENSANEVGMGKSVEKELSTQDTRVLAPTANDFALPGDYRYPINDLNQAITALTACSGRAEEENVKNAVYRKFPSLKGDVTQRVVESSGSRDSGSIVNFLQALCDLMSVKKSDVSKQERIEKFLNEKDVVPIHKIDKMKQVAYCVVLSPEELDAQDDWMTAEDIEDTAHNYMEKFRVIGKDHSQPIDATPVESYIAPQDLEWEDGPHGPQKVKKGSWILGIKVHDAKEWSKVLSGDYQGVSVGGLGLRD